MLGLACASCATSGLTTLSRENYGREIVSVSRRANGGLMVSATSFAGMYQSKAAFTRGFNQRARAAGCANGAIPRYHDVVEVRTERVYSVAWFYRCS